MLLHEFLTEAPLGSYDIVGDLNDRSSFRAPDRAIITAPKTPDRLRHAFRNTKETFDLVFVPLRWKVTNVAATGQAIGGVWRREVAHKRLPGRTLPEPSTPDAIMVVLTHNEGANRLPLSPWIIAHRIGHAVAFDPDGEKAFTNMLYTIRDVTSIVRDACDVDSLSVIYTIGKMRSARERRLNGSTEFPFECFTQYLITGRVSFNRFTEPVAIKTKDGEVTCPHLSASELNHVIDSNERWLNKQCAKLLASLRGKVVVL